MFKIRNESELLECFRPLERDQVDAPVPGYYPFVVKDYFAWTEPSGAKVFLVFEDRDDVGRKRQGSPLGVVFRRGAGGGIAMCEWCQSVGSGGGGGTGVGLLMARASENRQVGVHACTDLSCIQKIRGNPGVNDFPRATSDHERIRQLLARMSRFARQNLF